MDLFLAFIRKEHIMDEGDDTIRLGAFSTREKAQAAIDCYLQNDTYYSFYTHGFIDWVIVDNFTESEM